MSLRSFEKYISQIAPHYPFTPFDVCDKSKNATAHTLYTLCRTQSMFEWKGLPDSIPQRDLELMLQCNGNVCFAQVNDGLYAFTGGLGGEPNVYYRPTVYTIANPALNFSASLKIGEECEIIRNDSLLIGLLPLITKYATNLTETEVSIFDAVINSRIISLIIANDDRAMESAKKYIEDVIAGRLSIMGDNKFLESVKTQPYGGTGDRTITELIELNQYQRACLFNDLGLNANYNMKRESLNSNESQLNDDMLLPFVDDMLRNRQQGCERVNAMFGTSISVDFYSAWKDNVEEIELEQEQLDESGSGVNADVSGSENDS